MFGWGGAFYRRATRAIAPYPGKTIMRLRLAIFVAVASTLAAPCSHAGSGPDFTRLWPTESPARVHANAEPFDPQRLNAIDVDKPPRDPWRNGDPALVPREQRRNSLPKRFVINEEPGKRWTSPLSRELSKLTRDRPDRPAPPLMASAPHGTGAATRWITGAALLILNATGKITGYGRDTTADIGKPPLGINDDPHAIAVRGRIR
jgi:hypothetical protein